ncbi:hypothetical protein ACGFIK_08270 [Micromonospora sp. NPDC048871]|uniref:hypothetical protein n=1 Tax=unclassified Micromonospora TaxID=2617518 RepID=UPI002E13D514|nr:hypothetical protein OIE53_01770 [Micromonospora sp. NBC_01739]
MDASANRLIWRVEAEHLSRREAKAFTESVAALQHWLDVWHSLITATLARPLYVTVAATDGDSDAVEMTLSPEAVVLIEVPPKLARSNVAGLQMVLLDAVLGAVEEAAQRWPHDVPPQVWPVQEDTPNVDSPDEDADSLATALEFLEKEELLLLGRLDGTDADELSRFHELDDYVLSKTDALAEMSDTEAGCSSVTWILSLPGDRHV